jgi:hypothetical protein
MQSIGWQVPTNVKHHGTPDMMASSEKDKQIGIRISGPMRDAWTKAAKADGRSLSSWIIARCNGLPTSAPVLDDAADEPEPEPNRAKRRKRAR